MSYNAESFEYMAGLSRVMKNRRTRRGRCFADIFHTGILQNLSSFQVFIFYCDSEGRMSEPVSRQKKQTETTRDGSYPDCSQLRRHEEAYSHHAIGH